MAEPGSGAAQAPGDGARASDAALIELRAQLEQDRKEKDAALRRADVAERERDEARHRAATETDNRFVAEEQAIENGIAGASAEADRLEQEYARLQQEGEFVEAARKARELASAQNRLDSFTGRKDQLAQAKTQARLRSEAQARDPLAIYGPPGSPTRRWIDAHPRFLSDKVYKQRVLLAHEEALASGKSEHSPEYFAAIETDIGERARPQAAAGGRQAPIADADSPLSGAADTRLADEPEPEDIEVAGDDGSVEIDDGTQQETDMYDEAVRQQQEAAVRAAQDRARERAQDGRQAKPVVKKPVTGGQAAPPSRGAVATPQGQRTGRMVLTQQEAERALADYPPGEKFKIGNVEHEVKTEADSYRLYWQAKQELIRDNKIGPNAGRY